MKAHAAILLAAIAGTSAQAATFTVMNTNDNGAGSLRDAIAQSNGTAGPNTINFDVGVIGTIVLTTGQLIISNGPVTVVGPGAGLLAIDGNANDRVIGISDNPEVPCPGPSGPNNFLATISGLTIKNGNRTASNSAGGILSTKDLTLQNMVFEDNKARVGGAVGFLTQYSGQTLIIQDSLFVNNAARPLTSTATTFGGALNVSALCTPPGPLLSTVIIDNSLFQGNHAQPPDMQNGAGGAINVNTRGDFTLRNSRVVDNHVDIPPAPNSSSYPGGGLEVTAKTVTIQNSEISNNSAGYGGGLEVYNNLAGLQGPADAVALLVSNSTFSGNTASQSGGAMNLFANVATQIVNSTVSDNSAATTRTGGVRVANGAGLAPPTLSVVSSILANSNATTVDVGIGLTNMPAPYIVNTSNSLIEVPDPIATISGPGNFLNIDPMLVPLTFNGGFSRTHAVFAGSPVINAGSNSLALATDQRGAGFPRVIGATADMGAYESNGATFTVTNNNDSGAGSLRDTVAAAIAAGPTNTVDFAPNVTGTILLTSGLIRIDGPLTLHGPGTNVLAIDGNQSSRIFSVYENNAPACPAVSGPTDFPVTIRNLTLKNGRRNLANSGGGAILSGKSLTLFNVIIRDSYAKNGGGLNFLAQYPGQSLTVSYSQFIGNFAKDLAAGNTGANTGGAINVGYNCPPATGAHLPGTVSINNSLFLDNRVQPTLLSGYGGAIYLATDADVTFVDGFIVNNHVDPPVPAVGGQFYQGGGIGGRAKSLRIERIQVSGNTSRDGGSAAQLVNHISDLQSPALAMAARIVNSTISGNVDATGSGAILGIGNVAIDLDNTTVSNNVAPSQTSGILMFTIPVDTGGPLATAPTLKLVSSIVANGSNGTIDISDDPVQMPAFVIDATNSLVETICGGCSMTVGGSGNLVGVDPMLGPLQENGPQFGTATQAPLPGSPVINAGSNPLGLATDQRGAGYPRVVGVAADMGAHETGGGLTAPVLQGGVSRKVHGIAGTFNLPLP